MIHKNECFGANLYCMDSKHRNLHQSLFMIHKNACFGANLHSMGSKHRNLHQSLSKTSEVANLILRAYTGTYLVSHTLSVTTSRVTYLLVCGPAQEPTLAAANTGITRESFWKK